jgi:hypothetical protein
MWKWAVSRLDRLGVIQKGKTLQIQTEPAQRQMIGHFPNCFGNFNPENPDCLNCGMSDKCEQSQGNCRRLRTRRRR